MREFIPDLTSLSELWIGKFAGAIAGSLISLAYILPKGKREAAIRFLTGVCAGVVFGLPAGLWAADYLNILQHLREFEAALMGAALVSLSIWTVLGLALRYVKSRFPTPKDHQQDASKGDFDE